MFLHIKWPSFQISSNRQLGLSVKKDVEPFPSDLSFKLWAVILTTSFGFQKNQIYGEGKEIGLLFLNTIKMERKTKWMVNSGLKSNVKKTEICIFHRRNAVSREIEIMGENITTRSTMNVLGINLYSNMKWKSQVSKTIKESNSNLYGIKIIRKYFNPDDNKIDKTWLCLGIDTYKVKCKNLFLMR